VIRLLLDQGLPRSTVRYLQKRGRDVCDVADIGRSRAPDQEILELADEQDRVIVSLDSDLHRLLAISGARSPWVIQIRREGLRGAELAVLIDRVLGQVGKQVE
jgi:predicted nuclease of predicted toxin-antitoxin system